MKKKNKRPAPERPTRDPLPMEIIRKSQAHFWFGLQATQLDAAIESGKIPKPLKLGARAVGWTGKMIADWQAQKLAEANAK
jgi:predicted DNA-binding transcriptional regulator AlpA